MNYIAGDALAVIPANDPALADALIDKLGLSPDSQVPTPEGETASLKDALVRCYDITNVNKALLTKWAAASGSQELDALLAGDKDALNDFLWGRDMLDLATEYPASFESAEAFTGILKKIMPRLYSIASSPNAHPEQVHLCVGAVRYTARDRKRGGVCSTYMADRLQPGHTARVFVHTNKDVPSAGRRGHSHHHGRPRHRHRSLPGILGGTHRLRRQGRQLAVLRQSV